MAIVAGVGVLLLLGAGIFWAAQSPTDGLEDEYIPPEEAPEVNEQEVAAEFAARIQEKVVQETGQPIEGFEPSMFLLVYPGMQEHDFDNVDAIGGTYIFESSGLEYVEEQGRELATSADQAITDQGMRTLLNNIASRLQISLTSPTALADIFASLELTENNNGSGQTGQEVMLEGEIVCLPHKNTEGPQTLECAFGLQTQEGTHYDLRNLSQEPGSIDTGMQVQVTGTSTRPEADNIYDVAAVIEVKSIKEL